MAKTFNIVPEIIARGLVEGNVPNVAASWTLTNAPWLLFMGWAAALVFQLTTIIPILKNKNYLAWGLAAIVFHFSTGLLMGIWFSYTILCLLFFFPLTEKMIALARKHSSY